MRLWTFIKSSPSVELLPEDTGSEMAIFGRSNVGKSSLINALAGQKRLAYTSSKPGCTIYLNCYQVNETLRMIDFPGYGYAKRSKSDINLWQANVDQYLSERRSLEAIWLVLDARRDLRQDDMLLIEALSQLEIPVLVIFNKLDQLNQKTLHQAKKNHQAALSCYKHLTYVYVSAFKGTGLDDLRSRLG